MTIEEIIKKWEQRYESLYHSGMSETDDPGFALSIIRQVLRDLKEIKEGWKMRFYIIRERAKKRVNIKRELRKRNILFKINESTKSLKLKSNNKA